MERLNVCLCESETEEEQIKRIEEVLEDFKGKKGSLIQALHMVQGIYGYLPVNIQQLISERMEIPMSEVSGVISFYSFF